MSATLTETQTERPMRATQKAILKSLRKGRQTTVATVARQNEVDPQVARRHLDILVSRGLVEQTSVKLTGKRGRPAKVYTRI